MEELKGKNYEITAFDIESKENRRVAEKFEDEISIIWGDLRSYEDVREAVRGKGIVIHAGAVIPPLADEKPNLAEEVNVGGTKNVIKAMEEEPEKLKLVYTSSVSIYGDRRENPFITTDDDPNPTDEYAKQKLECEKLVKNSDLYWSIYRLSYVVSVDKLEMDPIMFEMPLETCIEIIHTRDAGLALANGVDNEEIGGETLNIAGGKDCRIIYRDYIHRMFDAFGLGGDLLPLNAFSKGDFHCGFMDTERSQRILHYQRHTLEDYFEEVEERVKDRRLLSKIFPLIIRPIIKERLLKKSPYFQKEDLHFL